MAQRRAHTSPQQEIEPRTAIIEIPWIGPTLNKVWAGVHWTSRRNIARQGHEMTCVYAKRIRPFENPVHITFQPIVTGKFFDASNYMLTAKIIEDGLVKCGVLEDDGPKFVLSVKLLAPIKGKQTKMKVSMREDGA